MIDVRGAGPVWAATVDDAEGSGVTKRWFREVDPPYRRGVGVSVHLFGRGFAIGVCRRTRASDELDVLGYELDTDVEEIADWDGSWDINE